MASPQHEIATMEKLPCDVLSNIFIGLLAKQLAQMRCVCKTWNVLLSQSCFIKSHLHRSIQNNEKILLVFYENGKPSFDSKPFTAHRSKSPKRELTNFVKLTNKLEYELTDCRIIGSVNGLICVCYGSNNDSVVHIWNPSLSALLTLPPCSLRSGVKTFFRFGLNPKTDDYKVVKLARVNKREWLQVEVYSMRKGTWELITQSFPSHINIITYRNEVCVDGKEGNVHWLGYIDKERKLPMMVAFDLNVETFREMPVPVATKLDDNLHILSFVLGVMSGKLCVMSRGGYGKYEIWVMDEYGVAESWVKRYVFSYLTGQIVPYGFTSHGEFLFEAVSIGFNGYGGFGFECETYLALFDPAFGKPKTFIRNKDILLDNTNKIVEYVDSLVWVVPPPAASCLSTTLNDAW